MPTHAYKCLQIPINTYKSVFDRKPARKKIVSQIQPAREKIENGRTQYQKNGKVDFS